MVLRGFPPMLYRDPKCVFVANDVGQANVVAAWLQGQDISAEVMNQATLGGLISPMLTGATGFEVWVHDLAQVPEAIRLLGDHAIAQVAKKPAGPPLDVVCEECGKSSTFPGNQRGSVQVCPHCGAYLDVEYADGDEQLHDLIEAEQGEVDEPRSDAIMDKSRSILRNERDWPTGLQE